MKDKSYWRDAPKWARASTIPMYFILIVYGVPTLALILKIITLEGFSGFRDNHALAVLSVGILASLWAIYCLVTVRRAKRYIKSDGTSR